MDFLKKCILQTKFANTRGLFLHCEKFLFDDFNSRPPTASVQKMRHESLCISFELFSIHCHCNTIVYRPPNISSHWLKHYFYDVEVHIRTRLAA